ncbi:MAG TPA: DUF262 domain-containing protein [Solirubrobacteraceae bacterium]|jgi:hypothetical protein
MRLDTILDNVDQGAIALPEFQRGYVWNRTQVRGLMESLYRGHPVGSLLTWLTKTESAITRGDGQLQPGTVQLLLDGQQRVTSLYGLIRGNAPAFFDGNSRAFEDLRFHLDEEAFEFWQPVKMRDEPLWVDVCEIFAQGAGHLIAGLVANAKDDPRLTDWIERINRITEIRNREFHIEQVSGEDKTVDVVVDIFNRVNSGGTKLSKGDLALAKICAEWPEARLEMKRCLAKWQEAGFDFSLELMLRSVNAIVSGRAPFSALSDRSPAEVQRGLARAERAIDKVLNTLSSRLGLNHGSVLPAVYPIVVLTRYLHDHDMSFGDHATRDGLLYWYIQASMWGRYAGSTESVLAQDLSVLAKASPDPVAQLLVSLRQQRGDLTVKPADFLTWSRGARFFPVLYMLTRVAGARDWGTGELLDKTALGAYSNLEIHHVFPKRVLYEAEYSRADVNAIANFTFLTAETNKEISGSYPADYLPEYKELQPSAVESHWIPTDPQLWQVDRYPDFLEQRRVLLAEATNAFLGDLYDPHLAEHEEVEARATPATPISVADGVAEDAENTIAAVRDWLRDHGFDDGELDYQLAEDDGAASFVLDVAWPRGLQVELSEPVALLLNEPAEVFEAAVRNGYKPFQNVVQLKTYAERLAAGHTLYNLGKLA